MVVRKIESGPRVNAYPGPRLGVVAIASALSIAGSAVALIAVNAESRYPSGYPVQYPGPYPPPGETEASSTTPTATEPGSSPLPTATTASQYGCGDTITLDQRVTGELSEDGECRYSIRLDGDTDYLVSVVRRSGMLVPALAILDDSSNVVSADSNATGAPTTNLLLSINVAGAHEIVLAAARGSGAFALQIGIVQSGLDFYVYPPCLRPIGPGERVIDTLADVAAVCRVVFNGMRGDVVTIAMNRIAPGLDPYLELHPPRSDELEVSDDDGGGVPNSLISAHALAKSGTYSIMATSKNQGSYGQFELQLQEGGLDGLEAALLRAGELHQVMQFNPNAALQKAIFSAQFVPNSAEFDFWFGGEQFAAQRAEHLVTGEVRSYYVDVRDWSDVRYAVRGSPAGARDAELERQAEAHQKIQFNPDAALQKAIFNAGFVPNSAEFEVVFGGRHYIGQRAEHLATAEVRIYYVWAPNSSVVKYAVRPADLAP